MASVFIAKLIKSLSVFCLPAIFRSLVFLSQLVVNNREKWRLYREVGILSNLAFFDFGYTKISKSYENLNTNYTEKVVLYTYSFHSSSVQKKGRLLGLPLLF